MNDTHIKVSRLGYAMCIKIYEEILWHNQSYGYGVIVMILLICEVAYSYNIFCIGHHSAPKKVIFFQNHKIWLEEKGRSVTFSYICSKKRVILKFRQRELKLRDYCILSTQYFHVSFSDKFKCGGESIQ